MDQRAPYRYLIVPPTQFRLFQLGRELKAKGFSVRVAPPPPEIVSPCGLALYVAGEKPLPSLSPQDRVYPV